MLLHLAVLAALGVGGAFAVHSSRLPAGAAVAPSTPTTREGHARRTAEAKATLEKLTETLNRLEKVERRERPASERALGEAARRAPSEAVRRLTAAARAQEQIGEALERGEGPKPAQAAAANGARERAARAVSLLPERERAKVAPLLADAAKRQEEALRKAAELSDPETRQDPEAAAAAKKSARDAQRDAEAALAKALARAEAVARAQAQGARTQAQAAPGTAGATGAGRDSGAKEPHPPGSHAPSCFAPGGI